MKRLLPCVLILFLLTVGVANALDVPKYKIKLECLNGCHHVIHDPIKGTVYYIRVTNAGNVKDTIILKAYPEVGIEGVMIGKIEPCKVTLDVSESKIIKLFVKGDAFTKPGNYVVKVTAVSQNNTKVRASIITITTVIGLRLDIISPTKLKPANAGFYKKPHDISVIVKIYINGLKQSRNTIEEKALFKVFEVYIGKKKAKIKSIKPIFPIARNLSNRLFPGLFKLLITPPAQDKSGLYDLTVKVSLRLWNTSYVASDTEEKAVYYARIVPPTPTPSPIPTITIPPPNICIVKIPRKTVMISNENYTIPVEVINSKNITGIYIRLKYNPKVIKVIDVKTSLNGSSLYYTIANSSIGVILTNTNGITAKKPLDVVYLVFKTLRVGFTPIDITDVELSDENFKPFKPMVVDGLIKVTIKGDFNGNGRIDIGDIVRVAYMIVGKIPKDPRADFNNNGRVDIGDLAKIAYYLLGKIDKL